LILACGTLFAVAVAALQSFELSRTWQISAEWTQERATNLACIAAQEVLRSLDGIRLAFAEIDGLLRLDPDRGAALTRIDRVLKERVGDLAHVQRLTVIGRDGRVLHPRDGLPIDFSDRDYFVAHSRERSTRLRIGRHELSPIDGQLAIPVTRRLSGPDGAFNGVLVAFLNPHLLEVAYGTTALGKGTVIKLFRDDGALLMRTPPRDLLAEHPPLDPAIVRRWRTGPPMDSSPEATLIDGVRRILGYCRVKEFPLVAVAGVDARRAREVWLHRTVAEATEMAAYLVIIALSSILLAQGARRQQRLIDEVRASEARFQDFAEVASDWLCELDADLRFSYISPRRQEITGEPPETMLGKTPFEVASPGDLAIQKEAYERHRQDLEARREFRNFSFFATDSRGNRRYVSLSGRPVFDAAGRFAGYRGAVTDSTARVAAEKEARATEALLVDAIGSLTDGFALFDRDDRLVLWNTAFCEVYPAGRAPARGDRFHDLVASFAPQVALPDPLGETLEAWIENRIRRHVEPQGPLLIRLRDGRHMRVIEVRTRDGGTVLLRTDETERVVAEEALAKFQRLEAIGQLTGGIAHDFNNLLTIIQLQAHEVASGSAGPASLRAAMQPIILAARRGAELIRQLLTFSRRQVLRPTPTSVRELIGEIEALLKHALNEDVALRVTLDPDTPPCLIDRAQAESALLNLVINARDAMPAGGTVTIASAPDWMPADPGQPATAAPRMRCVRLDIADTGHGMPPEVLQRAIEPFFTTKPPGRGTGLGLSMVYGFVRQSGGTMRIDSIVGEGTTVRLYLPVASSDRGRASEARSTGPAPGAGQSILLVEDDPAVRSTISAALRKLGYRVTEAADRPAALSILHGPSTFQLLMTDLAMQGGISGQALAAQARALQPDIGILIVSGRADPGPNAGDGYAMLRKPFLPDELAAAVFQALSGTGKPQ
jgi:PAS domain S-box-containing protein